MRKYKTQTGFLLGIRAIGPYMFQELKQKHNIDRPPFARKHGVKETGVELEFIYTPPEEVPDEKEDYDEWLLFQQYLKWVDDFERDKAEYVFQRNRLLLVSAVKILNRGKFNWKKDIKSGDWLQELAAANIDVNTSNRKLYYLKQVVLRYEADYLNVINMATVEEVTMGDVSNALDYFWTCMERCPTFQDTDLLAGGRDELLYQLMGGKASDRSNREPLTVVQEETIRTGAANSG